MKKIAIIACTVLIVAITTITTVQHSRHICRVDATRATLSAIAVASQQFKTNSNAWPRSLGALTCDPPYVIFRTHETLDPWGNPILYMPYNTNTGCGVCISWGADGKPGGTKQNRDIIVPFK